jgi:hypothetical protein
MHKDKAQLLCHHAVQANACVKQRHGGTNQT